MHCRGVNALHSKMHSIRKWSCQSPIMQELGNHQMCICQPALQMLVAKVEASHGFRACLHCMLPEHMLRNSTAGQPLVNMRCIPWGKCIWNLSSIGAKKHAPNEDFVLLTASSTIPWSTTPPILDPTGVPLCSVLQRGGVTEGGSITWRSPICRMSKSEPLKKVKQCNSALSLV